MPGSRLLASPALLVAILASGGLVAQAPPPTPVVVEAAQEREIVPTTLLLGTTEPRRRSIVAASIEGYVIDYPIEEGERVQESDVLTRLRDDILKLELREAEALLDEIRETHRKAVLDLERARSLIDKDAVTQKSLDAAVTDERTQALRVVQAEARIEVLRSNIAKKRVTAPFAGQVVREHTEMGEWVARGGPVATIVDITSVFVRVNVPERYIRLLREGARVTTRIAAAGSDPFEGTVVSVSNEGDPVARTFPVRVEVPNSGELRAGMSARVEIPTGASRTSLVISKDAVLLEGTRSFVFVVAEDSRVERRGIDTGASSEGSFEVTAGLRPGERVVIKGNERLQPGMPVRVLPSGGESGAEG